MKELLILLVAILFIVLLNTFLCRENFTVEESIKKKITLYIFLTNNCIFCKEFEKNKYDELVNQLGDKYDIKKIHLENNEDLFNKYNIERVPTAILENDGKVVVVKQLTKESILKAHQEMENNNYQEMENNNKKDLLIFLSKSCPHCINYLKNSHYKLTNLLDNDCNIKLIFADEDPQDLFTKYKIDFVPKAIILEENKEHIVDGAINYDNIKKILNKNTLEHMTNFNDQQPNNNQKKKLLIFLSKNCPHCIRYEKETHNMLEKELGHLYNINKIHDGNKQNEELFYKYNIKFIPKLLIVDNNDKVKEINGPFTPENIIKQDIDNSLNIYDENNYNYIDDENNYNNIDDENNYNILDKEILKNKKNHILIFLSKTCPKCVDYLQHTAPNIEKEFGKEFEIETMFIEDKSKASLLKEFNIKNVPQAFVKYDNSMYYGITPEVNNDYIRKTINDIKDFNIRKKMDNKLKDEADYKNIMDLYTSIAYDNTDKLKDGDDKEILIFLSKECDKCKYYDNNIYPKIENSFKNKCKLRKIYYQDNKNMFKEYGVQYVPQAIISLKDKYIPIEESIAIEYLNKLFPGILNKK